MLYWPQAAGQGLGGHGASGREWADGRVWETVVTDPATRVRGDATPSDVEVQRSLDRLSMARIRVRDVSALIEPGRPRVEAVERAHRAVEAAARAVADHPDDPEADKTHALAEITEIMALRAEGFRNRDDYLRAVTPSSVDPRTEGRYRAAVAELHEAQAEWERLKNRLVDDGPGAVIDLTGPAPVIETR